MKEHIRTALLKMGHAIHFTQVLKHRAGNQHGLFNEAAHRHEFTKYADAGSLIFALYNSVKIDRSNLALFAFANDVLHPALNMLYRLSEIKGINEKFRYFRQGEVDALYSSISAMCDDLLPVLLPDVVNQVNNILIESKKRSP